MLRSLILGCSRKIDSGSNLLRRILIPNLRSGLNAISKRPGRCSAGNDLGVVNFRRLYQVRGHLAVNPFIGQPLG